MVSGLWGGLITEHTHQAPQRAGGAIWGQALEGHRGTLLDSPPPQAAICQPGGFSRPPRMHSPQHGQCRAQGC